MKARLTELFRLDEGIDVMELFPFSSLPSDVREMIENYEKEEKADPNHRPEFLEHIMEYVRSRKYGKLKNGNFVGWSDNPFDGWFLIWKEGQNWRCGNADYLDEKDIKKCLGSEIDMKNPIADEPDHGAEVDVLGHPPPRPGGPGKPSA